MASWGVVTPWLGFPSSEGDTSTCPMTTSTEKPCRRLCWDGTVEFGDLKRSFPTWLILWFYEREAPAQAAPLLSLASHCMGLGPSRSLELAQQDHSGHNAWAVTGWAMESESN